MSVSSKMLSVSNLKFAVLAILIIAVLVAVAGVAAANSVGTVTVVTTFDDVIDDSDGQCSLREAVIASNENDPSGSAAGECQPNYSGPDTILLPPGLYQLTIPRSSHGTAAASGDLDIDSDLTIKSQEPGLVVVHAAINDRAFEIHYREKVTFSGLTISGGDVHGYGGGIYNNGYFVLENSTLTGNKASYGGGGLYNRKNATLINVTVTDNQAPIGSGLKRHRGKLAVINTMIVDDSCIGSIYAPKGAGINLRWQARGCSSGDFGIHADPQLLPQEIAGLPGTAVFFGIAEDSPAVDAGSSAHCPDTDQIGTIRPQSAGCDIGSFELTAAAGQIPQANPDDYTVVEDGQLVAAGTEIPGLLDNDNANGSTTMAAAVVDSPTGSINLSPDGTFTYTPTGQFVGLDTFTYEVVGDGGTSDPATVTIEVVEDDFTEVTNTCDSGPGTLRAAMEQANDTPGVDTIIFVITDESCGDQTITLASALPSITDQVVIDGLVQDNGPDRSEAFIKVDGLQVNSVGFQIPVAGQGSTIRGLQIVNFGGSGVLIGSDGPSNGNTIERNEIVGNGFGSVETIDEPPIPLNDGITIRDGVQNAFENNVFGNNADLDSDLGGDGFTPNDPGDPDTGANNLQNFPDLLTATPAGEISGLLNSIPNSDYSMQFFVSPDCTSALMTPLAVPSNSYTTDGDGNVFFTVTTSSLAEGQGIYSTVTDVDGNTSEISNCIRVSDNNDVWPRARLIGSGEVINQFIDLSGQSRWYKFPIDPNSQILVRLTNLPKNYDVALYTDIAAAYAEQVSSGEVNLEIIGAETAPTTFNPTTWNPTTWNPTTWNPTTWNPTTFNPTTWNPTTWNAAQNSGELTAPAIFNPTTFNPTTFNPTTWNPTTFNPTTFNGNAYSTAQSASLIAVSANDGQAPEEIKANSWNSTGFMYVRVSGRLDEFDLTSPYAVSAEISGNTCANLDLTPGSGAATGQAGNYESLILVDWARMGSKYGAGAGPGSALSDNLNTLAAQVNGVVVDIDGQGRVAAANTQADSKDLCPYAKNLVADAIKEVVDAYRDQNPNMKYVVLVGSDNDIPFYRLPDTTFLGQEENYVVPVDVFTSSEASLRNNFFLSQDPYVSDLSLSIDENDVTIPALGIGRLAETPQDIITVIDAYLATPVIQPKNAMVSSYDFLSDSGAEVRDVLAAAAPLNVNDDLLVFNPEVWTSSDLANVINIEYQNNNNHGADIGFLSGHFSANAALAADYATHYITTDLTTSSVDLTSSIWMSPGCHAAYNIVNEHNLFTQDNSPITFEPDWVQAFAQKGATLIAGTGYQYGDTDFIEYSERLYLELARQLRSNASSDIALGDALVASKLQYLKNTPDWRGIDTKTVFQVTLYGLPMQKVNMPGPRLNLTTNTSGINPGDLQDSSLIVGDPADVLGLQHYDLSRNYQNGPLQTNEIFKQLTNTDTNATVNTSYLELGANGSKSVIAGEPVLPLDNVDVSVTGTTLRGVGFLGGDLRDFANRQPLVAAATTELSAPHPNFISSVYYPLRFWNINRFDTLTRANGSTNLFITPAQYRSTSSALESTTLRRFDNLQLRLFYSSFTGTFNTGQSVNEPGLSGAPVINKVGARLNDTGGADFLAQVTVDPSAGVHQVWVTYITEGDPTSGGAGASWQSLFLSQDPDDSRLWRGTLPTVSNPQEFRYIIQAASGVGLVTMNVNLGNFYTILGINENPDPTALIDLGIANGPATGFVGDSAEFTAKLVGPGNAPLSDQIVFFSMGSNQQPAITNANGIAVAKVPLLLAPDEYEVSAWFQGTTDYEPSTADGTISFTVLKQPTSLELSPASVSVSAGDPITFLATMSDNDGDPITEQSVLFVLTPTGSGAQRQKAVITNPNGEAQLGALNVPVGSYDVQVVFNGTSTLKNSSSPTRTLVVNEPEAEIVRLIDSEGNGISGAMVKFYSGGWQTVGMTNESGEIAYTIPDGSYSFSVTYKGATIKKVQDIGANPTVEFQTVNVRVTLNNSTGQALADGQAKFYASGWKDIGITNETGEVTVELLPRTYSFSMKYAGGQIQKDHDVSEGNTDVAFSTFLVTVKLESSNGDELAGGEAQYYASGWKNIGTTDSTGEASIELLPKEYTFSMTHRGGRVEESHDVDLVDMPITFATIGAAVELVYDNESAETFEYVDDAATAEFYAAGWKPFGDFGNNNNLVAGMVEDELLGRSYTFALVYQGKRNDLSQDISDDRTVTFGVGVVYCSTCTHFYASGWKPFSDGMYMLPGEYTFRFSGGVPDTTFTIIDGEENYLDGT